MFGKQLNRSNNCYLSQVTMIESKCQKPESSFRKKVNMPATVFTRSPMKDRQNKSIVGNTPSRKMQLSRVTLGATDDSSRRTSISPLKNRRQQQLLGQQPPANTTNVFLEQNSSFIHAQPQLTSQLLQPNYSSGRVSPQAPLSSSINSQIQRSRKADSCQNHPSKPAKYFISIDDEDLPYCQKCAILLASQGFKVSKCDEPGETDNYSTTLNGVAAINNGPVFQQVSQQNHPSVLGDHSNPRRQEINNFLGELQSVMQSLALRRSETEQSAAKADFQYHDENTKLSAFYQQIIDEIVNHKKVIQAAVAEQHTHTMQQFSTRLSSVDEAISDSKMMKDDILSSLDLIRQAEEKDYRPIMASYKENARKFKQVSHKNSSHNEVGDVKFAFSDYNECLRRFLKDLAAALTGETNYQARQIKQDTSNHSSINFSFEGHTHDEIQRERERQYQTKMKSTAKDVKCVPGPLSQDQNPIELLSQEDLSREKFMKSSIKDHKGLFSEFDDFGV